jgi:hypothetical protein
MICRMGSACQAHCRRWFPQRVAFADNSNLGYNWRFWTPNLYDLSPDSYERHADFRHLKALTRFVDRSSGFMSDVAQITQLVRGID